MVSVDHGPRFSHFLARPCFHGLNLRAQEFLHTVERRGVEQHAGENREERNTEAESNRGDLGFRHVRTASPAYRFTMISRRWSLARKNFTDSNRWNTFSMARLLKNCAAAR